MSCLVETGLIDVILRRTIEARDELQGNASSLSGGQLETLV